MTEVRIFGEIGRDVTAKAVAEQLDGVTGDVIVRVNSGGGDVYEGIAIMNQLRACPGHVTVIIESLAASAASFIAVGGGDTVISRPNAEVMIHKAWTMNVGNADDMQRAIGDLQRQDVKLAGIYAAKAGGEVDEWLDRMSAETWYTAEEALESGLVDAIEDARRPVEPVAASSVRARYSCRAEAPPPKMLGGRESPGVHEPMPSDGRKEDAVDSVKNLAQELGVEPDMLREKLSGLFNEAVDVNAPITVTYPDEVEVNPTGKVVVEPDTELPEGLTVEPSIGEGFTAEADESGVVTVRASDAVAVDDTAELVITFSSGESVTVGVTVVAVDKDDEGDAEGEPAPEPTVPSEDGAEFAGDNYVTIPRAYFDELTAQSKAGEEARKANLKAEADAWASSLVRKGIALASMKAACAQEYLNDPELAEKRWGSLPPIINRKENGYGVDPEADAEPGVRSAEELRALSKSRMSGKK